jgi:hypothetical protein
VSDFDETLRRIKELEKMVEERDAKSVKKFHVNKRTHRVRFERETEGEVTVVIEPRHIEDGRGGNSK